MPTYQYSCNDCGHFFEIVQSFSDDSLTVCPECEGRLRKVFNAVGVVFKGSGFYRTDSRNQTTGGEAGSGGAGGESNSSKKSEGSTNGSDGGAKTGSNGGSKSSESSSSSSSSSAPAPA